jgi:inner membrane protein
METIEKNFDGFFKSVGFKLALIGFLTLVLLIPANLILNLIREREQRRIETIAEVSSIWGNAQTLCGPVISVPFKVTKQTEEGALITETKTAHFLPENLRIEGSVKPEERYRGIYKVVSYRASLHVSGNFAALDPGLLNISETAFETGQAVIEFGIPDMRGINQEILIHWGDSVQEVIPGLLSTHLSESGIHANISLEGKKVYNFSFDIDLNGSQSLNFIPLGKETNIKMNSTWNSPSFCGAFLPDDREINDAGFNAFWNILQLNRNFPQQWIDDQYSVIESSFGVELLTPVDTYRKSERSVKYAILFIALTFIVFFFAEVLTKTRIHFVYYFLTGAAICIFYSLLTALAEHMTFTIAYLVSSVIIAGMIGIYANSLYKKWQVTLTVVTSLVALYVFLFVILQMMDYSLLFGNIGLVIILGIVMYFSRKIDWYSSVRGDQVGKQ